MISLGLMGGEDQAQEEAVPLERQRSELLRETRRNAEADAIRHAEDLLGQEFPIVVDAERSAESQIADLRTSFHQRRGELESNEASASRRLEASEREVEQAEAALLSAGIPEDQLRLPPLQRKSFELRQVVVAAAAAAVAAGAVVKLGSISPFAAAGLLAVVAIAVWLSLGPAEESEPEEVARVRESWCKAEASRRQAEEELGRIAAEVERLERTTYAAGEAEVAFAGKLAGAYASAAFSSLPAGTLEGGRFVAAQRQPQVELPEWLLALAPEEE